MPVQVSGVNQDFPLILQGEAMVLDNETILTNGSRAVPLKTGTIMSQIASTKKWTPWLNANLGDNTGLQYALGIYIGDDIPAATIVAGDVTAVPILVGGAGVQLDFSLVVFDGGNDGLQTKPTRDSIATVPTGLALRAEAILNMKGIFLTTTIALDNTEN